MENELIACVIISVLIYNINNTFKFSPNEKIIADQWWYVTHNMFVTPVNDTHG